jgi:hypothetical protein
MIARNLTPAKSSSLEPRAANLRLLREALVRLSGVLPI